MNYTHMTNGDLNEGKEIAEIIATLSEDKRKQAKIYIGALKDIEMMQGTTKQTA